MGALTVCECAHPLNPFNPWLIHSGAKLVRKAGYARRKSSSYIGFCQTRKMSYTER